MPRITIVNLFEQKKKKKKKKKRNEIKKGEIKNKTSSMVNRFKPFEP